MLVQKRLHELDRVDQPFVEVVKLIAVIRLQVCLDVVGVDTAFARDQAACFGRIVLHPIGGADSSLGISDNGVEMFPTAYRKL